MENSVGVEGFGGVLFCKDARTVLVADQVLVVGGQQMRRVARSGCRSIAEYEKFPVAEMFGREFFGDARHGAAGFGRGESRPPGEITGDKTKCIKEEQLQKDR